MSSRGRSPGQRGVVARRVGGDYDVGIRLGGFAGTSADTLEVRIDGFAVAWGDTSEDHLRILASADHMEPSGIPFSVVGLVEYSSWRFGVRV
jgi:hypothetical protein